MPRQRRQAELDGRSAFRDIEFTTTPENTQKYAEFMHEIGSIENRPASWSDLFFPEIHGPSGS